MIGRLSIALSALAMTTAAVAEAPTLRTGTFNVGGVAYTMPLPVGFCLPTGQLVAVAQTVAATDTANVTNLTLYRCDAAPMKLGDYTLIKTPVSLISTPVDRATFLTQLAPEFDKPMPVTDEKLASDAADGYDRVTGQRPTIGMKLTTNGHDETCGYMSAIGTVSQGAITKDIAMGTCTAAIGGRVIQVIRYTESRLPADRQRMMREAKAVALSIKPTAAE